MHPNLWAKLPRRRLPLLAAAVFASAPAAARGDGGAFSGSGATPASDAGAGAAAYAGAVAGYQGVQGSPAGPAAPETMSGGLPSVPTAGQPPYSSYDWTETSTTTMNAINATNATNATQATAKCQHGFEVNDKCECLPGWRTAGITDTYAFLQGYCEQYECKDDDTCGSYYPGATCRIPRWNCYCGFSGAFANWGHGWETDIRDDNEGMACMGLVYTIVFWVTEMTWDLMKQLWKLFLVFAVLALPFGRKRSICDHHWPSIWNCLRANFCCRASACRGECVTHSGYSLDKFKDDLAWTLFFLDLGVWSYAFLGTLYITAISMWFAMIWLVVFLMLICGVIAAACCMLCEDGGGMGADTNECGECGECGFCCGDNWCLLGGDHVAGSSAPEVDMFYWSGPFPADPWWGYSSWNGDLGTSTSSDCDCRCCFRPLAWLLYVFPVMPENAWGGFAGVIMGTHPLTDQSRVYQGGDCFVEFLAMRWRGSSSDLHENDGWRFAVFEFLTGEAGAQTPTHAIYHRNSTAAYDNDQESRNTRGQRIVAISPTVRAIHIERQFNEDDGCVPSSYSDYEENECWICRMGNPEWDLWLSCHHLFCQSCSSEMLRRRMPCPLCRVSSTTVLRGLKHSSEAADDDDGSPPPSPSADEMLPLNSREC